MNLSHHIIENRVIPLYQVAVAIQIFHKDDQYSPQWDLGVRHLKVVEPNLVLGLPSISVSRVHPQRKHTVQYCNFIHAISAKYSHALWSTRARNSEISSEMVTLSLSVCITLVSFSCSVAAVLSDLPEIYSLMV